jgi:hypothetical protein
VVCLSLIAASGGATDDKPAGVARGKTGGVVHGEPDRGLAAFLAYDGARFKAGDPLEISFGLIGTKTNDPPPPKRVKVLRPFPPAEPNNLSWISVAGPDGKELRYQGEYIDWANPQPDDFVVLTQGAFAGQTFSELVPYHYDLRQPGKYRLRWHYAPGAFEGAWAGQLTSNEVEIEIVR